MIRKTTYFDKPESMYLAFDRLHIYFWSSLIIDITSVQGGVCMRTERISTLGIAESIEDSRFGYRRLMY